MYWKNTSTESHTRRTRLQPVDHLPNGTTVSQGLSATVNPAAPLQNELEQWKQRSLRLASDLDNFKKRTSRESEYRAAKQKAAFVQELLPVVDNLERALTTNPQSSTEQLREGVEMTLHQLMRLLNQHGFHSRDDIGQAFNPQFHEAVCVRSEPAYGDLVILEVWQRGWQQGKELFRPAKVVVNDLERDRNTEQSEDIHPQ